MKNRNRMIVNCVTASLMYYWSLPALAEQSSSEMNTACRIFMPMIHGTYFMAMAM